MLFNSYVFIFAFLPISLSGYYALSLAWGARAAKTWLILASIVYYGWWNPANVILVSLLMLFNFAYGKLLWSTRGNPAQNRLLLVLGVAANLLVLGYYKYANFFVDNLNACAGTSWHFEKLILPLGISFFTFQQIAYLVDASRGVACEGDMPDYLLFITFFPHSIAGPIVHHTEMMPQFARHATYRFSWENMAVGLTLFAFGLGKKVIIADLLSGHVSQVFGAAAGGKALYPQDAWAGTLAYTFQLYFDFSGYSDMALGLARMFGIVLPLNFDSPYQATSLVDFWRRWHMTLSRLLRDYVYIPLGGGRRGAFRRYVNLMLTMVLGGLWHGAGWTFIMWGALHGGCLAANHLFQAWAPAKRFGWQPPAGLSRWSGRVLTFLVVMIGWVFFRAGSLGEAWQILSAMAGAGTVPALGAPHLLKPKVWIWLAGVLVLVWGCPNAARMMRDFHPAMLPYRTDWPEDQGRIAWRISPFWAGVTAVLLAGSILCLSRAGEFLYYNF